MHQPLSQTLEDFSAGLSAEHVTLHDLLEHFKDRSLAFFLFVFALPAAIPLPGLGVNLIIAAPLVLLTLQQLILREHVWLPQRFHDKQISKKHVHAFTQRAIPWIKRLEIFTKPRLGFIASLKPVIGLCGFLMALSVCIPLPLTNTVPSMGIAIMALGTMTKDGLAIIAGMLIGVGWIALLTYTVIVLGVEGIDILKETIKSFL